MRSVGDKRAIGTEECTGKVESFFDVGGYGGLLEGFAHGFGDGHEAIGEQGEKDWVWTLSLFLLCHGGDGRNHS